MRKGNEDRFAIIANRNVAFPPRSLVALDLEVPCGG